MATTGHRLTDREYIARDTSGYSYDERKAHNDLRRLFYAIAGGQREYYDLPAVERVEIREKAHLLFDLGADFTEAERSENVVLEGFVYVISNPAWNAVKVGRAYSPQARLRNYQTSSPNRDYRLHFAEYFEDCRFAEAAVQARLNAHQLEGEWFAIAPDEAQEAIEAFARLCVHQLENSS